jgi:hypothetical protein
MHFDTTSGYQLVQNQARITSSLSGVHELGESLEIAFWFKRQVERGAVRSAESTVVVPKGKQLRKLIQFRGALIPQSPPFGLRFKKSLNLTPIQPSHERESSHRRLAALILQSCAKCLYVKSF